MRCEMTHDVGIAGVDGLPGDDHQERCPQSAVWRLTLIENDPQSSESEGPYPLLLCEPDRETFMDDVRHGKVDVTVLDAVLVAKDPPRHRLHVSESVLACKHEAADVVVQRYASVVVECASCLHRMVRPSTWQVRTFWLVGPFAKLSGKVPGQYVEITRDGEIVVVEQIREKDEPPLKVVT